MRWARLVGGALALALAAYVGDAWAPDRPVEALVERWAPPPSRFVEVDGLRVHVRDEGPRSAHSPVVLVHGTSSSLHSWDGWTPALAADRRVLRFDLPGFGLTGPFEGDDYSMRRYVSFVLQVIDAMGVDRFAIAGNSFGGNIAWEVALAAPERITALVLVDASGYPFHGEMPLGFRLARLPVTRDLMEHLLPRRVVERSLRSVYGDPTKVTEALIDRHYELALRTGNRRALRLRFAHLPSEASAARIRSLSGRFPTLIVWGGRDRLIPPSDAERFHADIAGSTRLVFDALGHVPQEEDPVATVAPVRALLERADVTLRATTRTATSGFGAP